MVYCNEEEKCKKKQQPQKSYWKYAYGIAGMEDNDDNTQEESGFRRIDEFWLSVSKIADETTGLLKFTKLCTFALLCVFVLPHGNAEPGRGFSINKHLLEIHGPSMKEDTIVALRLVKDCLIRVGGIKNFDVTRDLIKCCREARQKYDNYLKAEKEKAELEEKRKKEAAAAAAASQAEEQNKSNKKVKLQQHKGDLVTLKKRVKAAENVIREGSEDLSKCLSSKCMDKTKLLTCQSKIDMFETKKRVGRRGEDCGKED